MKLAALLAMTVLSSIQAVLAIPNPALQLLRRDCGSTKYCGPPEPDGRSKPKCTSRSTGHTLCELLYDNHPLLSACHYCVDVNCGHQVCRDHGFDGKVLRVGD